MYVFKEQPYVKARASNTSQTVLRPIDNIIYLLRKPLADDPIDTVIANYTTDSLIIAIVSLTSYDTGIGISQHNNSPNFVSKSVSETISGTKTFYNLPKLYSEITPTNDLQFVPKKYVDDAVANAGSSGATVTYIEWASSDNPFVFEEHEPGIYVFGEKPKAKTKTSDTATTQISTANDTIYYLRKPLADDPDNTLIGIFTHMDSSQYKIVTNSSYSCGFNVVKDDWGYFVSTTQVDQEINGIKTFVSLPKMRAETTPTDNLELVPKKYVDDNLPVFFIEDTFSLNNPFILEGKKPGIYNIFNPDSSKKATMLYIKGATSNTTTLQYGLYGAFVIVRDYVSAPTGSVVAMYMAENLSYYGISKTSTNNAGLTIGGPINNYSKLITSHGNNEITGLYKFTSDIPQITSTTSPSLDQHIVTKKYVDSVIPTVPTKTSELTNDSGFISGSNFAVVSCELPLTSTNQFINNKTANYPEGFTKDNTYLISPRYKINNGDWITQHVTIMSGPAYSETLACYLKEEYIVFAGRIPTEDASGTATLEALLMKKPS